MTGKVPESRISDIDISRRYAQESTYLEGAEYLRERNAPPIQTTIDVLKPVEPASVKLIGTTQRGTYALFASPPAMQTARNTAFQHNLADSIGPGDLVQEKIENASLELRNDPSYEDVQGLAKEYSTIDKNVLFTRANTEQYKRG